MSTATNLPPIRLNGADAEFGRVPPELAILTQWVVWKVEERNGLPTKVPYCVTNRGTKAKTNNGNGWGRFHDAIEVLRGSPPGTYFGHPPGVYAGIGFVFAKDVQHRQPDPYVGIDFDGCWSDGQVADWARPWLAGFAGCYMEVSPSGNGIKVWARGVLSGTGGKRIIEGGEHAGIEIYDRKRFFTVTGNVFGEPLAGEIPDRQEVVDRLYAWVKEPKSKRTVAAVVSPTVDPTGKIEWLIPVKNDAARTPEERAILYAATIDPAVSGQGGHGTTFRAVCAIGPGFNLSPDVCFRIVRDHYNPRCEPPWSEDELRHKVESAYATETRRGWLLNQNVQASPELRIITPQPESQNGQLHAWKPQPLGVPQVESGRFPVEAFPEVVATLIEELSTSMSTAPDFVGASILAVAGAAIGQSVNIGLTRTWSEAPQIYAALGCVDNRWARGVAQAIAAGL